MVKRGNTAHVLIVRFSAMGDVAMLVPCILALREQYPNLKITILTRERFKPIFNGVKNVTVFSAKVQKEHKGFIGLYRLYRQLNTLGIDAVADTHNVLRSKILKLFFDLKGITVAQIDKGRKEKKRLINRKVFKQLKTTHRRYTDVFQQLKLPIDLTKDNVLPTMALPKIMEGSSDADTILIGIAPFAAYKSKMYPLVLMNGVLEKLTTNPHVKVLLFGGGQQEVNQLEAVQNRFSNNVINVAGKLSFEEELAVISNLRLMIAMDSGNGHLAANYGVDVVTLWGVTHPYAGFAPFGQPLENSICADREKYPLIPTSVYGNKHPPGYEKVMETISPETVYQMIIDKLDAR
ncbi:glycosyltransferase family 9 protein [Croceitalea sp. MTPC5]|uniref:glycosyltransferase family 9 protein n=1 Tax=Croceitalea sp. MTPC5 TaxID=3056565 RepID=UPI002B3EA42A|nr:glycosyltransferase family 9 protein [Croceitalea sp. MTPC5]